MASNIKYVILTEWKDLAKECLGIIKSATLKDKEIIMLIESAVEDLERVKVDVENNTTDSLIKNTVMIYVKAHYGDTDLNKRRMYLQRYKSNLRELQYSEKYQMKEVESDA